MFIRHTVQKRQNYPSFLTSERMRFREVQQHTQGHTDCRLKARIRTQVSLPMRPWWAELGALARAIASNLM